MLKVEYIEVFSKENIDLIDSRNEFHFRDNFQEADRKSEVGDLIYFTARNFPEYGLLATLKEKILGAGHHGLDVYKLDKHFRRCRLDEVEKYAALHEEFKDLF